ncbi:phage polarity suppression protein [Enterobacter roggenkampii]|uniref:phage polarity suppression protein n=1 Tax=Enterobacter roggenkampii TaxID=1812935 RepID=UPI00398BBD58
MQKNDAEMAAVFAPRADELFRTTFRRSALLAWLAAVEKINYSAQDNDILTAIGFRPDAALRDDNREKFTTAQNVNYTRRRAELAAQ